MRQRNMLACAPSPSQYMSLSARYRSYRTPEKLPAPNSYLNASTRISRAFVQSLCTVRSVTCKVSAISRSV